MKYRVVGWTSYDGCEVSDKQGAIGFAERHAIIDDIQKNGYLFTGWDHQEMLDCAPVLNDGKRRCFSQRGFGGLMAEAHAAFGEYDYAGFTFYESIDPSRKKLPKIGFDPEAFTPEENLAEEVVLTVPAELLFAAKAGSSVTFDDSPALRYLDAGDTLTLITDGEEVTLCVLDVDRERIALDAPDCKITIKYSLK